MKNNHFEYAFLKSEIDSEILLFVKIKNDWVGKELDISLDEGLLKIEIGNEVFNAEKVPLILSNYLQNNTTTIYFTTKDGEIVSESTLEWN